MTRQRLGITGIVQGVGFRPFVYRLAGELNLGGFVLNTAEGVILEIEGEAQQLDAFKAALQNDLPPLARIDTLKESGLEPTGEKGFTIRESDAHRNKTAFLSPDTALCDACLKDMRDPSSRFYRYPFTTCTNCGPRYTIIRTVPYDRPNTSMAPFAMCEACEAEYHDPASRRYHAQPLSCPDCGPTLRLLVKGDLQSQGERAIKQTAAMLKEGRIVAVKGLGGFHLMCDATNETAVAELRRRKNRPAKPFALMYPHIDAINTDTFLKEKERVLLQSRERPIVLTDCRPEAAVAPNVAPGIERLGVFLPYTPIHHLLFEHLSTPLVATSANMSDEPIITDGNLLQSQMGDVVDALLDYDREIVNGCDDSVVQIAGGKTQMLRMGRGFAPASIPLSPPAEKNILAVGANQKNSLAVAFGTQAVLSPHIGDLGSIETFGFFERTLGTLQRFYDFAPDTIVHDNHPNYVTARWAKSRAIPHGGIQHHYAHILAALFEHGREEKVLGFAFDGTGYGDDGTIWGAEVLLADRREYERLLHLKPFKLLGGDAAVKEPRRSALALLFEQFGLEEVLGMDIPTVRAFEADDIRRLHLMWAKSLQAPATSSAGRLFDAAASLCGAVQTLSYEGESGLILESLYDPAVKEHYPFTLNENVIDTDAMIRTIAGECAAAEPRVIASRFINTLGEIILAVSQRFPEYPVVLGGGVFQNRTLVDYVVRGFETQDREYLLMSRLPVNDGGIAAGQLCHALNGFH